MRPSRACAARSLLCAREACTMLCAAHVRARAGVRGRRRSAVVAARAGRRLLARRTSHTRLASAAAGASALCTHKGAAG